MNPVASMDFVLTAIILAFACGWLLKHVLGSLQPASPLCSRSCARMPGVSRDSANSLPARCERFGPVRDA